MGTSLGPARYYADPAGFARDCAPFPGGGVLNGYQETILWELSRSRRLAVRAPSGAGKTAAAALAVLWFAITRDAAGVQWRVVVSAGGWSALANFLWPEIHAIAQRLDSGRLGCEPLGELPRHVLHLRHGSVTSVSGAPRRRDPVPLADPGGCPSVLFVFDDASGVTAPLLDLASGEAWMRPDGYVLAVSTPGAGKSRFRDIFEQPGEFHWAVMHVSRQMAVDAGRMSTAWTDQRAEQWGEGSALYEAKVNGNFPAESPPGEPPQSLWMQQLQALEELLALRKKRREAAQADDDERATRMRAEGKTYREIAAELGMESPQHAHEAVLRCLIAAASVDTAELRRQQTAELSDVREQMWRIVRNPGLLTDSKGEIVRDDATGEPLPDVAAAVEAATLILRACERLAKLLGLTTPADRTKRIQDVPVEDVQRRLEELRAEFEAAEQPPDEKPPPIPEEGGE